MRRGALSLTCCAVLAAAAAAARGAPSHGESTERQWPLKEDYMEERFRGLPTEAPEDTVEAAIRSSREYERTSVQDRAGVDPLHPDLTRVTMGQRPPGENGDDGVAKTSAEWIGKSTRCTAYATGHPVADEDTTAENGPPAGAGAGGLANATDQAGDTTTSKPLKEKVIVGSYAGAHTGTPEEHYVDDA